jgi:hypothetical protein
MERLWGYVSGREEFGEKEFQSLVLDLPGIVPGGHPDPTRTEVLDLMFRTLPDMPHFIRSSMSNQVSKLDALHRDLFRELASEDPRAGADLFGDELRDPCEDILWGLIHRLQNHNQAERDSLIARLEPIVINVIRSGDQKTLENLFKSRFLGIVCTPNVVVSALERFKFSDEFFDELSKVFFPRLNPLFKDQAHKDNLIAKLEPIVIDAFRSGDQKTLENLFKSGIHLEVCTSNVIASALDRLRLSKDDQALQMRHASEVDLMLSRTSADTVLEQFVIDSIRSSDYQTLWNLVEWRMHPGACTPHVIASALDHFESLKGDLPAQRMFFPLLDQMLWCTPADKDLLSTIPRIEPKLFELVPRAQEYGSHGGGSVTALVHLSLNGQINGLDEKLRARICDAESDEGTLDLCLYGLSKLPTTQANFECVLSRAKLWMDEDRLNLVGSAASSLEAQSRAVSAETDLGDVKGRLLDLLGVADEDTQLLVGKTLTNLDCTGHTQGLRHDLHLRLSDPNQSSQAKVVDLAILNALPVNADTLSVVVELLEDLSEDDRSKLAYEVFSSVGKMIGQAPAGLDVRDPQRRWLERGCTILKESSAQSFQFRFTRDALLERSNACEKAEDAALIIVEAIEALKPKGALEIQELLRRSGFHTKAHITPELMGCYVDLIAECLSAPLHSDADSDRSILLRSVYDNRLAEVLKETIWDSLFKLGKGSTEMREVIEQKCAAIERELARERQQGEGVEPERIEILQDLLDGLSRFLRYQKTLER